MTSQPISSSPGSAVESARRSLDIALAVARPFVTQDMSRFADKSTGKMLMVGALTDEGLGAAISTRRPAPNT
jgi:hypothetical protein